ncbi:helix-turn-helix domain-containing protein [Nocardia sp. NPDC020380]|uniref:helix-turn-helix domain-containing protein n=1 Tax=Nocardia sp. NPDC020380 TaxID=3364309 RepID=UPI0037B0D982
MRNDRTAAAVIMDGAGQDEDPALLRRVLGARLRRLRETAGISGEAAGRTIRASHSKISRLEAGRVGFRARDIDDLLTLYGVIDPAVRAEYAQLASRANAIGRWENDADLIPLRQDTYVALEDAAAIIRCYAPGLVPELVRTPSYAHTVSAIAHREPAADIQRRVELLMRRQHLLTRPGAPKVWFVIEEAALRRPIGGNEVWQTQLDHLADLAVRPNITVQVLPDYVGGPAISSVPFTVLRFAAPELSDLVHLHHATGTQFLDKRADLDRYNSIWSRLCVCATPPEQTLEVIDTIRSSHTLDA